MVDPNHHFFDRGQSRWHACQLKYYVNANSQETAWELPAPAAPNQTTETTAGNSRPAGSTCETKPDVVPDSSPLPPGWGEVIDESSGRIYYYNSITQETSWDQPKGSEDVDHGTPSDLDTTIEEIRQVSSQVSSSVEIPTDSQEENEACLSGSMDDEIQEGNSKASPAVTSLGGDLTPEVSKVGKEATRH